MSDSKQLLVALADYLGDTKASKLSKSIVAVLEIERRQEQNRIIQLIKHEYRVIARSKGYEFLPEQIDWLIELIKGETNE